MDGLDQRRLARMPLAEAVLLVWRWWLDERWFGAFFERNRGRAYQRVLSFGVIVHLIADALVQYEGSGRQSFERAAENDELEASIQAAYGKLRRIPIGLSMAFLAEGTDRLQQLLPAPSGKALVALSLQSGLPIAMRTHPDGIANDILFVPDLLPEVRSRIAGSRLCLSRRGIERMFDEVTTVFGLKRLIGSTTEASVFQFALCLLLYNLIQWCAPTWSPGRIVSAKRSRPRSCSSMCGVS